MNISFDLKNTINEARVKIERIPKRKIPLSGSAAKECTLLRMPDLTIKDPNTESKKVIIERKTIQESIIFVLLYIRLCEKAVPAIQGIKDTFSTGSQNQYPPHPSS